MKTTKYILLALTVLLASSCSDWLDVQPTTEKDREDLVTTAEGYKEMLYGTYINLRDTKLYGNNLTYGLLEVLARNYCGVKLGSGNDNYSFTDTGERGYFDDIWSAMYNNIANVNSLLLDIDGHKDAFAKNEYDLCAGEAYAERAFMHFDLLRMFAPRYEGHESDIAIPYVDKYERARYPHVSEKTVVTHVLSDLDKADSLLREGNDPLVSTLQTITYNGKGNFTGNRQYRFNYWAVQALKARVYMYMGDKANALRYATKVISESPFRWVTESEVAGGDKVFQSELIMGLEVPKLPDYYDANFANSKYTLTDGWGVYGLNVFGDANDYRYLYLIGNDKDNNKVLSVKYKQDVGSSKVMKKQTIPLMRLGEMYLIAAECQKESNPAEAVRLLRTLKQHRGILSEGQGIIDNPSADQIQDYVRAEMRKETYAEGQMWFYYKRVNSATTPDYNPWWAGATYSMKESYYTFPLPESEKEYGIIPSSSADSSKSKK